MHVPVQKQVHVPMVQKVQKEVEVPQIQYEDQVGSGNRRCTSHDRSVVVLKKTEM